MYYITCYHRGTACMVFASKSKPAAEKRAQKARATFERVTIEYNEKAANVFDYDLNYRQG